MPIVRSAPRILSPCMRGTLYIETPRNPRAMPRTSQRVDLSPSIRYAIGTEKNGMV